MGDPRSQHFVLASGGGGGGHHGAWSMLHGPCYAPNRRTNEVLSFGRMLYVLVVKRKAVAGGRRTGALRLRTTNYVPTGRPAETRLHELGRAAIDAGEGLIDRGMCVCRKVKNHSLCCHS